MNNSSVFTERGWTEFRNYRKRIGRYLVGAMALSVIAFVACLWFYSLHRLRPLQQLYLVRYIRASALSKSPLNIKTTYILLVRTVGDSSGKVTTFGVTDDQAEPVRGEDGKPIRIGSRGNACMFRLKPGIEHKEFFWQETPVANAEMANWFAKNIYSDVTSLGLLLPPSIFGFSVFLLGGVATLLFDYRHNRDESEGRSIRGTLGITVKEYSRRYKKSDGVGLLVGLVNGNDSPILTRLRKLLGAHENRYWIRIPRNKEAQHLLLLGDSGTGKSQVIHSLLRQVAERGQSETAVIYDPACEFVSRHFCPDRGDLILNPLDTRSLYWSPSAEIEYSTDRALIAESFFPGRENSSLTAQFFVTASRSIFSRMLELSPTPEQLIQCLQSASLIDALVKGTECAHYIDPNAGNQRGGVLGSLAEVGASLKLLPSSADCGGEISLSQWARNRKGWLFITSTRETRDALRPLQAVILDILLKRLMSSDTEWGGNHPCWMIVDEAHSLKRLPALHDCLSEGRKHGIKIVLGTQGKSQFEEYYGNLTETMLSIPNLKILFRTNEPRAAKWVADLIGDNEREKQRIGTNAAVNDNRDSINYSTITEVRPVISKEQIMGLEDLCGYWKYRTDVVGFRLQHNLSEPNTLGFEPREEKATPASESAIFASKESRPNETKQRRTRKPKQARPLPISSVGSPEDVNLPFPEGPAHKETETNLEIVKWE